MSECVGVCGCACACVCGGVCVCACNRCHTIMNIVTFVVVHKHWLL